MKKVIITVVTIMILLVMAAFTFIPVHEHTTYTDLGSGMVYEFIDGEYVGKHQIDMSKPF